MNLRTSLTNQDITGQNSLTVALFHAKAFGLGISAVFGTTHTFLMSHVFSLLYTNLKETVMTLVCLSPY